MWRYMWRQGPPTCIQFPVWACHIHIVKSSEPAKTTSPLGCHFSQSIEPLGPSNDLISWPSVVFHTFTIPAQYDGGWWWLHAGHRMEETLYLPFLLLQQASPCNWILWRPPSRCGQKARRSTGSRQCSLAHPALPSRGKLDHLDRQWPRGRDGQDSRPQPGPNLIVIWTGIRTSHDGCGSPSHILLSHMNLRQSELQTRTCMTLKAMYWLILKHWEISSSLLVFIIMFIIILAFFDFILAYIDTQRYIYTCTRLQLLGTMLCPPLTSCLSG